MTLFLHYESPRLHRPSRSPRPPGWSRYRGKQHHPSIEHNLTVHQGVLAGFDQKSNIVLSDCKERVYSTDEGVEEIPLGLYLVKGETVCELLFPPVFSFR